MNVRPGISIPKVAIGQPGYILFFTGSKVSSPVYWDNVNITWYKGAVIEENHYYPFGLTLNSPPANQDDHNNYLLTTKELQTEHELNWYDFGARTQDMQTGRWGQIDPLLEEYYSVSPYSYAGNNPAYFVDRDGRFLGTAIGGLLGGLIGGVTAAINHQDVFNGFAKGAVSGMVAGAVVDISIATGGTGLVALAVGGAASGMAGDLAHQALDNLDGTRNGYSTTQTLLSTATGGLFGALGGLWSRSVMRAATSEGGSTGSFIIGQPTVTQFGNTAVMPEVEAAAKSLAAEGKFPATVSGATLPNGATAVGPSGRPPTVIAPQLQEAVDALGGVGSKYQGNTVGCCSEFQNGNNLLLSHPQYGPGDVLHSPALRPRTGQIVPPCPTCQFIFGGTQ